MPLFTILVPTRERADTLRWTLRTLVTQNCADCEFIVSDNASEDDTHRIVSDMSDSRLRYIRTPKRVSMRENWEFALEHARGDYVTVVGDDDGLLPDALTGLSRWIDRHSPSAISWQHASYYWPNYSIDSNRNRIHIRPDCGVFRINARTALSAVRFGTIHWRYLPVIYGGLVRRNVMEAIRAKAGHHFGSENPDVYSGIAVLTQVDDYLFTGQPFSVLGYSAKSNASTLWAVNTGLKSDLVREFRHLFQAESNLPSHRDFPATDLMSNTAFILESLYRVREDFLDEQYQIPVIRLFYRISRELNRLPEPARTESLERLRPIARQHHCEWLQRTVTFAIQTRRKLLSARNRFMPAVAQAIPDGLTVLDGSQYGVRNIEGACALVGGLQPIPSHVPNPTSTTMPEFWRYLRSKESTDTQVR